MQPNPNEEKVEFGRHIASIIIGHTRCAEIEIEEDEILDFVSLTATVSTISAILTCLMMKLPWKLEIKFIRKNPYLNQRPAKTASQW